MEPDELAKKYIDAWNQRDPGRLLGLMHAGAAYYDAFWMETCVGRDLAQYFQDALDEEPFWYEQIGETIRTESGIVFRYSAHECDDPEIGEPIYVGAEILSLWNDKILTVTDTYCLHDPDALAELAKLAATRHGLSAHVNFGLGALKAARIKDALSTRIDNDKFFLDPAIRMYELAEIIGCTLDQLSAVIERQFGTSFEELVDTQRVAYAKDLLQGHSGGVAILEKVAVSAGFASLGQFNRTFAKYVGITPRDFCQRQQTTNPSQDSSYTH